LRFYKSNLNQAQLIYFDCVVQLLILPFSFGIFLPENMTMTQTYHRISKILLKSLSIFTILLFAAVADFGQSALNNALDFDRDGQVDPAIFRASNNTWYIQKSGGGYIFQTFGAASSDILVPGDYDGDSMGDIAIWRNTDAVFHYLRSSDNAYVSYQFGMADDQPVARDYDGDGKIDFAVARRVGSSIVWYIRRSFDGVVATTYFGLAGDYAAPGDYDGDRKYDIAVYRPTPNNGNGTFHLLRSNLGYTAITFGLSNDLVVPGDYDGDRKTDCAIVRDTGANLVWYVYRSSDGSAFIATFGLGGGGDFPVQGDYDGDGMTDIAIWRSSTGTYYIYRSSDYTVQNAYWGIAGDFPIAYYDVH
jgi:hypothetical protein